MKSLKFIWIDDDPTRKHYIHGLEGIAYKTGQAKYHAQVEFINLKGKSSEGISKKQLKGADLIIIDYILSASENTNRLGSTLAASISEVHPSIPIFGVTADDNFSRVTNQTVHAYEDLLPITEVSSYYRRFFIAATTFKTYRGRVPQVAAGLIKLLRPPKSEVSMMSNIVPRREANRALTIKDIYRFVNELYSKPGPLLDANWTANLIGLSKSGFKKVEALFKDAEYSGVFCDDTNKRWWRGKVKEIVFSKAVGAESSLPWEAGRYLRKFAPSDYAKCEFCGDPYPEALGFRDTGDSPTIVPLHIRCSQSHPGFKKELYFEDIRLMNEQ